jgi:hypothetical protein
MPMAPPGDISAAHNISPPVEIPRVLFPSIPLAHTHSRCESGLATEHRKMSSTIPNQGPAITPFTPPESCLSTTTFRTNYSGVPAGFTLGTDEACFPSPTREFLVTSSFIKLYSPGVCPGGYVYASPCASKLALFLRVYFGINMRIVTKSV